MLRMVDLGWAAGFMEGECSFIAGNNKFKTPMLTCPQKCREPLDLLAKLFPINGKISRKGLSGKYINPMYVWTVSGAYAVSIMFTVCSLMSKRRQEQIRNAISHWRTTRPKLPKGMGWRTRSRIQRGEPHAGIYFRTS